MLNVCGLLCAFLRLGPDVRNLGLYELCSEGDNIIVYVVRKSASPEFYFWDLIRGY